MGGGGTKPASAAQHACSSQPRQGVAEECSMGGGGTEPASAAQHACCSQPRQGVAEECSWVVVALRQRPQHSTHVARNLGRAW